MRIQNTKYRERITKPLCIGQGRLRVNLHIRGALARMTVRRILTEIKETRVLRGKEHLREHTRGDMSLMIRNDKTRERMRKKSDNALPRTDMEKSLNPAKTRVRIVDRVTFRKVRGKNLRKKKEPGEH